jgi:(R,R)-butanediol dehydrogenase/meso-butanediol dehydrogenase/diacetyl reductase
VRAGIVTAPRRFELVDFARPEPKPGTAVVDVALCGICGTDLHGFLGPDPYNPSICGHELTGTIAAVGESVTHVREGDRVIAGIAPPCGRCDPCRAGQADRCLTAFLGMVGRDALAPPHGGFAPQVAYDASRLIPVTGGLTDAQAAMIEPTTVALHATHRTPVPLGAVVVVQGCGPIGLLTLQCAKADGAGRLIAVEPNEHRRALALELGADEAVTPEEAPAVLGDGADLVFECAGAPPTLQAAVDLVRSGGTVNLVGLASGEAAVRPGVWLVKEVAVVASLGYLHHEFAQAMDLVADGRIRLEPLHDSTVALDELPAAIERLADDPSSAVKVLVDPRREREEPAG